MQGPTRNDRQRATDVARDLARAAALLQHLAAQNARLRERVRQVRREVHPFDPRIYAQLQAEAKAATDHASALREENRELESRCQTLEEEHWRIGHLYNAMHQLHGSRTARGVVQSIGEILREPIGAQQFAVYLYDERTAGLRLAVAEGVSADFLPVAEPEGPIWRAMSAPAVVSPMREGGDAVEPPVVVALRDEQRPVGAIVVEALIEGKYGFRPLDHELFRVLATHAATAVLAARLHAVSERKRATMDGLIELLTR